jgi:hypothetical protein
VIPASVRRPTVLVLGAVAAGLLAGACSLVGQGELVGDARFAPVEHDPLLFPGARIPRTVVVRNPAAAPAVLLRLDPGISQEVDGCPAGSARTSGLGPDDGVIPPGGVRAYTVISSMAADADNRCQGRTFRIPLHPLLGLVTGG